MLKNVSKGSKSSHDKGKIIPAKHLNSLGKEIGRKGLIPRKEEIHPGLKACSIPRKNMTLARPVGMMKSDPEDKWEATWEGKILRFRGI